VVGALVDGEDLRVAAVLLDRVILEEAGAAEGLDGGLADVERLIRGVRLDDGREQLDLALVVGGELVVLALRDFMSSSMRRTSGCCTIGTRGAEASLNLVKCGPCLRSLA